MFATIYSYPWHWSQLPAVFAIAAAIKLMDDALDDPPSSGRWESADSSASWAQLLGRGTIAYALLMFSLAAALAPQLAVSLFAASYAIGMADSSRLLTPLRLPSWLESLLALGIGYIAGGRWLLIFALAVVTSVHFIDDFFDEQFDPLRTAKLLLGIAAGLVALALAPGTALSCLIAGLLFVGPLAQPPAILLRSSRVKVVD